MNEILDGGVAVIWIDLLGVWICWLAGMWGVGLLMFW